MSLAPHLPASPLVVKLDKAIAAARDPIDKACLRGERAALWARHGNIAQAREETTSLRGDPRCGINPRVQAWLSLAEGLADYFSDLEPAAREKIQRAYTQSLAVRMPALHSLAAAWLAHLDYVNHDIENTARHVSQALHLSSATDHATRTRACLVVAYAYHYAGQLDRASPWYRATRRHAAVLGDEATLSALMHNMAWMRAHMAREAALFGGHDAAWVRQTLMGAESTAHFDAGMGSASLHTLVPILRAQLHTMLDEHEQALVLYENCLTGSIDEGLGHMETCFRGDVAWSLLQLGRRDAALAAAEAAEQALDERCLPDDQAYGHQRLAHVFEALGQVERADGHARAARICKAEFDRYRASLSAALDKALIGLKP